MLYRTVASLVVLGALSSSALAARTPVTNATQLANQYFEIAAADFGYFSPQVLDVSGESRNNGAPVIIYSDHDGNNQRWQPLQVRPGVYVLRNANSLRTLRQQGSGLVQDTYNPGRSDARYYEWTFAQPNGPRGALFTLRNNGSGQYLAYNRNGGSVTLAMANPTPNRYWYFLVGSASTINTSRTCL